MTVEWLRIEEMPLLVHRYRDHADRYEKQTPSYRGRTSLFKEELQKGNASLKLSPVRVSDEGEYKCLIEDKSWYDDIIVHIRVEGGSSVSQYTAEFRTLAVQTTWGMLRSGHLSTRDWLHELKTRSLDESFPPCWKALIQFALRIDQRLLSLPKPVPRTLPPAPTFFYATPRPPAAFSTTATGPVDLHLLPWLTPEMVDNRFNSISPPSRHLPSSLDTPECCSMTPSFRGPEVESSTSELQKVEEYAELQRRRVEDEFIKKKSSSVDVTLDPDTAHPRLRVSADGKQVTHGDTRQENLTDTPERFKYNHSVVGKQSFSSGRFYYEVQVRGNTRWTLGVMRESVNRKGGITWSPQGGFWTVILLWNQYWALADPDVLLTLREKVEKVGVFVDYEEGLVSFYDVESRSHIYSFTETLKECRRLMKLSQTRQCEISDRSPSITTVVIPAGKGGLNLFSGWIVKAGSLLAKEKVPRQLV
ncbi:butyrophilin subfamily 2 member A2-like [Clarias gariepinus]